MANHKKIQLTYLWSDESVLRDDIAKKISSKMTDWANAFFKRFEFDLDVDPKPLARGTFSEARKYVLAKSDGVMPDLRDPAAMYAQDHEWLGLYEAQSSAADQAIKTSRIHQRYDDSKARVSTSKAQLDRVEQERATATDPSERQRLDGEIAHAANALAAAEADFDKTHQEFLTLYRASSEAMRKWNELNVAVNEKIKRATGEYKLRAQMALKFREQSIGSDQRVNVVFCKFRRGVTGLRMRPGPHGLTFPELGMPIYSWRDGVFLWKDPFIIVNLALDRTHVIAHEVIHATGRDHPRNIKIYRAKPVPRAAHTTIAKGSLGGFPFSDVEIKLEYSTIPYEEISGGTFDGPVNDIMSYGLEERDPATTILSESDKKALGGALFVI